MAKRAAAPLEADEMRALTKLLDATELLWCHVPNERVSTARTIRWHRARGLKPGVPDVLIFSPRGQYRGLAIELKRAHGGRVSDDQVAWYRALEACGWRTAVCYGAAEAWAVVQRYRSLSVPP